MYELKFEDKVKVWKDLREDLETSSKPFYLLSKFIKNLPRSTRKQNPWDPESVILPWHLIENNSFTEYEIALLSAYTLQLTDRFSDAKVEIHISKDIINQLNTAKHCITKGDPTTSVTLNIFKSKEVK